MRKLALLIFVAVLGAAGWFAWAVLMPAEPAGETFVLLHPGYSTRRIAHELKAVGVIRSEDAFVLWHYVHRRRSLKAGEYLFDKPGSIIDIQKRLRRGDVYFRTVVVPEGFTMFDIARAIEAAGLGSAQDFLTVAKSDTGLVSDVAPGAHSLEGYLFPETYEFSRLMSMHDMAAAMVKQFRSVAHQVGLVANPADMKEAVLSPAADHAGSRNHDPVEVDVAQAVTMASIIEKETSVANERPLVASVYYNRLVKRIALDADPSIIYGELLAGSYTGALHHADMQFKSAYNTYTHVGLPPGPIGNPGRSSLEAALHPAQSDYFYFVADAQGHHRFAHSLEEHNKNVVAYRRAMRAR